MRIYFRCPDCNSRLWAPAELADGEVFCAECGEKLEVPRLPAPGQPRFPEPVAIAKAVKLRPDKQLADGEVDMTPMVDVVFNLLIFFMVTASFSLEKALPVPMPKTDEASTSAVQELVEEETDTITVRVDSNSTFRVICPEFDEEAPSEQELIIKLRTARDVTPSANKLMVIAHGDARHDKVVAAMDAGTTVGMDGVKLTTVEEDEY
jgi:biopolymer transport protein ExbD